MRILIVVGIRRLCSEIVRLTLGREPNLTPPTLVAGARRVRDAADYDDDRGGGSGGGDDDDDARRALIANVASRDKANETTTYRDFIPLWVTARGASLCRGTLAAFATNLPRQDRNRGGDSINEVEARPHNKARTMRKTMALENEIKGFRNDGAFRNMYGLDLAHERKIIESNVRCQKQSMLRHFPNLVLMDIARASINHHYPQWNTANLRSASERGPSCARRDGAARRVASRRRRSSGSRDDGNRRETRNRARGIVGQPQSVGARHPCEAYRTRFCTGRSVDRIGRRTLNTNAPRNRLFRHSGAEELSNSGRFCWSPRKHHSAPRIFATIVTSDRLPEVSPFKEKERPARKTDGDDRSIFIGCGNSFESNRSKSRLIVTLVSINHRIEEKSRKGTRSGKVKKGISVSHNLSIGTAIARLRR
ncbi:hypothetical protein DBV15_02920 [Temnothorax longispinosus]|uniref:Uncharacterized protein n=1 Tax=Temnothorax longispinosus TaxID=300112 RepID=A0A4V3S7E5_9HYME|nr:hypothetical protein DBV15_02920 [Temnothorax longispinosus]